MRIYFATHKPTGREWAYCMRRTYGRTEVRAAFAPADKWFAKASEAREYAERLGRLWCKGDAPLVTIVD